jgi:hypothetical protein
VSDPFEGYNETTDLYLEILREAQRIADRKLIAMIQRRLKSLGHVSHFTSSGCEIIPFPNHLNISHPVTEEPRFWPRFANIQLIALLAGYLLLVGTHSFWS